MGLTWHANEVIQERGLEIWQVVGLTPEGRLLREVADAKPRPKVEMEVTLPGGTLAKTVCGYDAYMERAILITVHFFGKWQIRGHHTEFAGWKGFDRMNWPRRA